MMARLPIARALALCAVAALWPGYTFAGDYTTLERGRALATSGNCSGCHTLDPARPLAGGLGIKTPFGTIYASNLTPDRESGIGRYTADTFYRAMHEGINHGGSPLYPAFPYPWYTKMTREDVDALKAYLDTFAPVKNVVPPPDLLFPTSIRASMHGWNLLFFKAGEFQPRADKSAQWNRGAYLVEGPAHCGACHTPKNILGADKTGQLYQGGLIDDWHAPTLDLFTNPKMAKWSIADFVTYLKTGRNAHSVASGPMAEVVMNSTQHVLDADLTAMGTYLNDRAAATRVAATGAKAAAPVVAAGAAIYRDNCAACHTGEGTGITGMFPSLVGNAVTLAPDTTSLLRVIIDGAGGSHTQQRPTRVMMPAFGFKLNDAEVAALASYMRQAWGNDAGLVEASAAKALRARLAK